MIAVGSAATAAAIGAPSAEDAIEALYGDTAAFQSAKPVADAFQAFMGKLEAKMVLTDAANLKARVQAFETASGSPIKIEDLCTDTAVCTAAARDAYALGYRRTPADFESALTAWVP